MKNELTEYSALPPSHLKMEKIVECDHKTQEKKNECLHQYSGQFHVQL